MRKEIITDWDAVRAVAMDEASFWALLDGLPSNDPLTELERRVAKLSYPKLRAYVLRLHFLLLDLVERARKGAAEFDEEMLVRNGIITLLRGRAAWTSIDLAHAGRTSPGVMDLDRFVNHVSEVYWEKFVVRSKIIRDSPIGMANAVYDLDRFATVKPSWMQPAAGDGLTAEMHTLLSKVIFAPAIDVQGLRYWRVVVVGVQGLMGLRDKLQNREELMTVFLEVKKELGSSHTPLTNIQEDLLDELEAVLIRWYPMNDFWTSTFEEFVAHPNFREHWP